MIFQTPRNIIMYRLQALKGGVQISMIRFNERVYVHFFKLTDRCEKTV